MEEAQISPPPQKKSNRRKLTTASLWLLGFLALVALLAATRYFIWLGLVNESMDSIWQGKMTRAAEKAREAAGLMSFLPDNKSFALNLRLISDIYACRRHFRRAETYNASLLAFDKRCWGEKSAEYAADLSELALMKRKQRKFPESEKLYREVVGIYDGLPAHRAESARNQALLAWVLYQQGKTPEALEQIDSSDKKMQEVFGEKSWERLVGMIERSYIYKKDPGASKAPDLETPYRMITEPQELSKSSAQTVVVLSLLAQMLEDANEPQKALKTFEIAEANCKSSVFAAGYNTFMADILEAHARLLKKLGQIPQSEVLKRHAKEIRDINLS